MISSSIVQSTPGNRKLLSLSPHEASSYLQGDAAVVDIRPDYDIELRRFGTDKIYYLPYCSYKDNYGFLPKDKLLIIADSSGNRSAEIARFLLCQGYTDVACLSGGMVDWERAGMPVIKEAGNEMIGGCACRLRRVKDYGHK